MPPDDMYIVWIIAFFNILTFWWPFNDLLWPQNLFFLNSSWKMPSNDVYVTYIIAYIVHFVVFSTRIFDDVMWRHNDVIRCWFFTASKVLGCSLIIWEIWSHSAYQFYVTFSESDPSFRFSKIKKSMKMNLLGGSNPCFRVSRYRWIRW